LCLLVHTRSTRADGCQNKTAIDKRCSTPGAGGTKPKTLVFTAVPGCTATRRPHGGRDDPPNLSSRACDRLRANGAAGRRRAGLVPTGDVYGGPGGLTSQWFAGPSTGAPLVVGDGRNRLPMVHIDDLADRVRADRGERPGGLRSSRERPDGGFYGTQMATAAARAPGMKGKSARRPS